MSISFIHSYNFGQPVLALHVSANKFSTQFASKPGYSCISGFEFGAFFQVVIGQFKAPFRGSECLIHIMHCQCIMYRALVAQSIEGWTCKWKVAGSNLGFEDLCWTISIFSA